MKPPFLFVLLLLLHSLCLSANAAAPEVQLVNHVSSIRPGEAFEVGIYLKHPPMYHTYWKFPGTVGVQTKMEWQLPQGWKAEDIQWPAPKRVFMFQIRAQGYHDEVVLPIKLTPASNLVPGSNVTIKGKVSWMCCGKDCNPGQKEVSLTLPVSVEKPRPASQWKERFDQAKTNIPQPLQKWTATASIKDKKIIVLLTPPKGDKALLKHGETIHDIIFFTEDGLVNPDKPQKTERAKDGSIALHLELSEYHEGKQPSKLLGVIQTNSGWVPGGSSFASISPELKQRY